jgi:hypothetical protein
LLPDLLRDFWLQSVRQTCKVSIAYANLSQEKKKRTSACNKSFVFWDDRYIYSDTEQLKVWQNYFNFKSGTSALPKRVNFAVPFLFRGTLTVQALKKKSYF